MKKMIPAVLGGKPAFPEGLPRIRPRIRDASALARRLGQILDSGQLTNGPVVRELEERVAERCGVPHAVAVSGCTSGLMLTYQALGIIGPVVVPSFTSPVSAHAVVWAGGRPRFADIAARTLTVEPASAAGLVQGAAALTATHVNGRPCDVERLQGLADRSGLPLVYDAAHALGSRRRGRPIGGFGTAEVFSLGPTEVAVAGEGGLVTTSDAALAEQIRLGRDYGNPGDYDCRSVGINARLSELHAAVALASLEGLDERIAHRNRLVEVFTAASAGLGGLSVAGVDEGDLATRKDLLVVVDPVAFGISAPQLEAALALEGIASSQPCHPPVHRQKAYAAGPPERPLPVTDAVAERVLALPLHSEMFEGHVHRVADAVTRIHLHARHPAMASLKPAA